MVVLFEMLMSVEARPGIIYNAAWPTLLRIRQNKWLMINIEDTLLDLASYAIMTCILGG